MPYELLARLHTSLLTLRREHGQGTVEYVGVVMVVAALIAAVVAATRGDASIAEAIIAKVKGAINDVGE